MSEIMTAQEAREATQKQALAVLLVDVERSVRNGYVMATSTFRNYLTYDYVLERARALGYEVVSEDRTELTIKIRWD